MIKVIIVDDHALIRQSIGMMLQAVASIDVVGEADSGESAVDLAAQTNPDVVLMDVRMPGIGGLEASRRLLELNKSIRIIGLTGYNDGTYPGLFMSAGASGYITKDTGLQEIETAIQRVHEGHIYLAEAIARQLEIPENEGVRNPFNLLAERELQVALLIAESYRFAEIAQQLNLSERSIRNYRFRILDKLGIDSDIDLAKLAIRFGMITAENINPES